MGRRLLNTALQVPLPLFSAQLEEKQPSLEMRGNGTEKKKSIHSETFKISLWFHAFLEMFEILESKSDSRFSAGWFFYCLAHQAGRPR